MTLNHKLAGSRAWKALEQHQKSFRTHMRDLFAHDPDRFAKMSCEACGVFMDYSKHRATNATLELLFALARQQEVERWRDEMFAGTKINATEDRAVLHVALRNRSDRPILVDGRDVMPDVRAVLGRMREFTERVRNGRWLGATGKRITDIVNIGIGGSDLGPAMVTEALRPYWQRGMRPHFVSNVDGTHMAETLRAVDAERTL